MRESRGGGALELGGSDGLADTALMYTSGGDRRPVRVERRHGARLPHILVGDYDDDIELISTGSVLLIAQYAPIWWVRVVLLKDLDTLERTRHHRQVPPNQTSPVNHAKPGSGRPDTSVKVFVFLTLSPRLTCSVICP